MISLIKIRAKYLSRHKCAVYCSYCFIPTLIFIAIILALGLGITRGSSYYRRYDGKVLKTNLNLFEQDLNGMENTFAFITEDKNDCKIIEKILSASIKCETKESDIENKNFVLIKIINKDGKYDIKLKQNKDSYVFPSDLLSTDNFIDLFISPASYYSYMNSYMRNSLDTNYDKFLQLQFLMSKFLIEKKGKSFKEGQFLLNIGTNSHPTDSMKSPSQIETITAFTIIICLQFSMTTYFFNIRMIDEKEKKLTNLLERQGVSKKNYFLSWMYSFLILSIIPLLAYLLFYMFFFYYLGLLFVINLS